MAIELLPYVIAGIIAFFILNWIFISIYRHIRYGKYKRIVENSNFLQAQIDTYTVNHNFIESLLTFTDAITLDDWHWRSSSKTWSMGECLKHIELYNKYYIEILQKAIDKAKASKEALILSGRVVYFSDALLPNKKNGQVYRKYFFKTKTKKRYNPKVAKHFFEEGIMADFLKSDAELIATLKKAENKDLNKLLFIKDDFCFGFRWIRLGELIELIIAHNMRHFRQIVSVYHDWENNLRDRSMDDDRSNLLSLDPI